MWMERLVRGRRWAPAATVAALAGSLALAVMPASACYNLTGDSYTTDWQNVACGTSTYLPPYFYHTCTEGYYFTANWLSHSGWNIPGYQGSAEWSNVRDPYTNDQPFFWAADCQNASVSASCEVDLDAQDLGCCNPDGTVKLGYAQWYTYPNTSRTWWGETVLTTNGAAGWYVDGSGGSIGSNQIDMQATVAHEMGHQLGMAHSVKGPGDATTMECIQERGVMKNQLTSDDKNGELRTYIGNLSAFGNPGPAAGC